MDFTLRLKRFFIAFLEQKKGVNKMDVKNQSNDFINLIGECSIKYRESTRSPVSKMHIHDAYEITLILSENVSVETNNDTYDVPYGSLLIFNTMDAHRIKYTGNDTYRRFVLWFKKDFLDELDQMAYKLLRCFFLRNFDKSNLLTLTDAQCEEVHTLYKRLKTLSNSNGYMKAERLKLALADFLITVNHIYLTKNEKSLPEYHTEYMCVYKAILYIQENFASDVSRGVLAKLTGMNERRLCDNFKKVTGLSTNQYVINFRISAAKKLLLQGRLATDVCWSVGFDNYSNFSRTFKNYVGISPKQYEMRFSTN